MGAGKDHLSKPRPVIVIQDNRFDATDSITVIPTTTTPADAPLLRIPIEPGVSGLDTTSYAMIDKVSTTSRGKLRQHLGEVYHEDMLKIERSLMVFFGLAG
jgi:mRNA interferase MazF